MKNPNLRQLFEELLQNMYSSEGQIIETLPILIKLASLPELKEALSHHLKETEDQVIRVERIFSLLSLEPTKTPPKAIEGILNEAKELIADKPKSPALDAAIISAAQRVEHYEIAAYGSLKNWANDLGLHSEIVELLQKTLGEENGADKKLTKIAEGTFFSSGVNQEAAAATG